MDSWQLLKADKQEGLRQIYDRNIQLMLHYGIKIVPDKDKVEDAIHDLFVYIWDKRQSVRCTQHEEQGYLCLSLKRALVRKQKNKEFPLESVAMLMTTDNAEIDMIKDEIQKIQSTQMNSALNQLTSRQKEALELRYQQGMDYEQISRKMNMNYQSCRNLVFRALSELRLLIKPTL